MPTPFSHLLISRRLLDDETLPAASRQLLLEAQPAFLLGGIIADARPTPDSPRADTHFYHYDRPMPDHPWCEMLRQYPSLKHPTDHIHQAFIAGYVAHLAADEYWSRYMLKPHFVMSDWGEGIQNRFYMLHLLLIFMDERDEMRLPEGITAIVSRAQPDNWLPFMTDDVIREWRDFIVEQIEGESQTVPIMAERIQTAPEHLRAMLNDAHLMDTRLWQNISPQVLADIELDLYAFSREQMLIYMEKLIS